MFMFRYLAVAGKFIRWWCLQMWRNNRGQELHHHWPELRQAAGAGGQVHHSAGGAAPEDQGRSQSQQSDQESGQSQGKFWSLIGWHKTVLTSDWLAENNTNLWLVDT